MSQAITSSKKTPLFDTLRNLLQASPDLLQEWVKQPSIGKNLLCIFTIVIGCGVYGFTIGFWRSPLMGLYVGIKFPLLIFVTLLCNGFLNGILGFALESELNFKQSTLSLLMSFTIFALINLGLAPVTLFFATNMPNVDSPEASINHACYLLIHTVIIGISGIVSNLHLYRFLKKHTTNTRIAAQTLGAWLLGNAFVGAQFSWILRPFFGSPNLEVQFLRQNMMEGTFYESIFLSLNTLLGDLFIPPFIATLALTLPIIAILIIFHLNNRSTHESKLSK